MKRNLSILKIFLLVFISSLLVNNASAEDFQPFQLRVTQVHANLPNKKDNQECERRYLGKEVFVYSDKKHVRLDDIISFENMLATTVQLENMSAYLVTFDVTRKLSANESLTIKGLMTIPLYEEARSIRHAYFSTVYCEGLLESHR